MLPPAPVVSTRLAPDSQVTVPEPSFLMYLYSMLVAAGSVRVTRQLPRVPVPDSQVSGTALAGLQFASSVMLPVTKMFWPKLVSAASLNVTVAVVDGGGAVAPPATVAPAWIAAAQNAGAVMAALPDASTVTTVPAQLAGVLPAAGVKSPEMMSQ